MKIGTRVQLKRHHKPIGTIIDAIPPIEWNGAIIGSLRVKVKWDEEEDGESMFILPRDLLVLPQ